MGSLSQKDTGGSARETHGTRTGAHEHMEDTDEPHNRTIQARQHTRTTARRPNPRIRGRLNSRSPGAERSPRPTQKWSLNPEEAAPSEPDPAASRSESASPRLLEGGWRNECARSRRVAAGGASGLLEPPMTR